MSALKYWIWLSSANIRAETKTELLMRYGDAERIYFASADELELIKLTEREKEILKKHDIKMTDAILEKCEMQNIRALPFCDAEYPKRLRNIYAPPAVLYVRGRLPNVDENAVIAVVGTRKATPYGIKMSRNIAYELIRGGGMLASGLTHGIDAAAAEGALLAGGTVIGVLGTSHEQDSSSLAEEVAVRGALLSEYPPMAEWSRRHWRERNRITAGLSVGVVAVEAPEGSGTRLFVQEAVEQGKAIFAVPGNADAANSYETNAMIKEGAQIVTGGQEILAEFEMLFPEKLRHNSLPEFPDKNVKIRCASVEKSYAGSTKKSVKPERQKKEVDKEKDRGYIDWKEQLKELSEDQLKIISAVERSASHIDDIIEQTGLSAAKVLAQLTILEIKGYIGRDAGKRIYLKITKK